MNLDNISTSLDSASRAGRPGLDELVPSRYVSIGAGHSPLIGVQRGPLLRAA